MRRLRQLLFGACLVSFLVGCRAGSGRERVTVYCAHDREFAGAILDDFQARTGIEAVVRYDTEANKSVGLYEDLIREAAAPRCDVHWNNEILATLRLQEKGILAAYDSPAAAPFPPPYRAADHTWTAFAARSRVLLINTERVAVKDRPAGLFNLLEPRWRGKVAMARPLFGTTATQAACLFAAWGDARAEDFYRRLHANGVAVLPGNKQVAVGVGAGQFDAGLTDTDDAWAEVDAGRPVAMIDPAEGVLLIPNTVAVVKNGPQPEAARKLVDYLLSPEVEMKLARSPSRQVPLNPQVQRETPPGKAMPIDFHAAAAKWTASQAFLVKEFALR